MIRINGPLYAKIFMCNRNMPQAPKNEQINYL
jgi:hypothetical protein